MTVLALNRQVAVKEVRFKDRLQAVERFARPDHTNLSVIAERGQRLDGQFVSRRRLAELVAKLAIVCVRKGVQG